MDDYEGICFIFLNCIITKKNCMCIFHRPNGNNMKDKHKDGWFKETSLKEDSTSDDNHP